MTKRNGKLAIVDEFGDEDQYTMYFTGGVYNPHDLYGSEYRKTTSIDAHELTEEQIRNGECMVKHMGLALRQKSELLGLELLVHSQSKDEDFNQIEHYRNGYFVSVIAETYQPVNTIEFIF
jgi:hypothetical protein